MEHQASKKQFRCLFHIGCIDLKKAAAAAFAGEMAGLDKEKRKKDGLRGI